MIYDHNQSPPKRLPDIGSAVIDGNRVAWTDATDDQWLATFGLHRQGTDDPIPEGHRIVSQKRVIRDGKSVLARVTEPAPVVDPQPEQMPNGIETPAIIIPHSSEHDWRFTVIDGVPISVQISASPRVGAAEQGRRMAKAKADIDNAKEGLAELLESNKLPDMKEAVRRMAKILNLV